MLIQIAALRCTPFLGSLVSQVLSDRTHVPDVLVRIEIGLVPIFLRLASGNEPHFLVRK